MKIPFTLDAWLKDKSQKVETRDGRTARIICTDAKADDGACIIALITGYGGEEAYQFFPDGRAFSSKSSDEDCADLFIITPEPELSEFEKAIKDLVLAIDEGELQELGVFEEKNLGAWAIKKARELLILARDQFIKDGYVIEKKALHDAFENISDKHLAEMSIQFSIHGGVKNGTRSAIMNWETFQKVAQKFINIGKTEVVEKYKQSWFNEGKIDGRFEGLTEDEKYQQGIHDGKEEALKDLPRLERLYSKENADKIPDYIIPGKVLDNRLVHRGFELNITDLETLPGFKEDEK